MRQRAHRRLVVGRASRGEREVGLRALGAIRYSRTGLPKLGASASRTLRGTTGEDLVAEVLLQLLGDLLRERVARIVHRAQQPLDLERADSGSCAPA